VLTDYLTEAQIRGHRPHTIKLRRSVLTALQQALDKPLLEATTDDVTRWLLTLQHKSPNTISTYARSAAAFYGWAVQRGHLNRSPMTDAPMPRQPKSRPRPIPDAELRVALDAASGHVRTWLVLAAFAGLRAGEIARLRRENVVTQADPPYLEVINGKGGRDRRVVVGPIVVNEVAATGKVKGVLWTAEPRHVSWAVAEHFRGLGMPYTCHQLRHSFATRLFRVSHDLRLVQEALGHSSPTTTAVYAEPDSAGAARAVVLLEADYAA
jgi:integrase/recombinase XerC